MENKALQALYEIKKIIDAAPVDLQMTVPMDKIATIVIQVIDDLVNDESNAS